MRLALSILGTEVFAIEYNPTVEDDDDYDGSGSTLSYPVGFTPSPGDQRWERGAGDGDL